MGNRHVTDGSLDFGQGKDVFHQLCHFGACEIFDLRGKALNRAAQIAKAVGALGAVPVQAASRLAPFRLGAGRGFSVLSLGLTSFFDFGDKKRPSTFRIVRPVNGQFFGIQLLCSVRQTEILRFFVFQKVNSSFHDKYDTYQTYNPTNNRVL